MVATKVAWKTIQDRFQISPAAAYRLRRDLIDLIEARAASLHRAANLPKDHNNDFVGPVGPPPPPRTVGTKEKIAHPHADGGKQKHFNPAQPADTSSSAAGKKKVPKPAPSDDESDVYFA